MVHCDLGKIKCLLACFFALVDEKPNGCRHPIDLTFLLDGSDSINSGDFEKIKNWILLTVDAFEPSRRNTSLLVSVVQYSEISKTHVLQEVRINSSEIESEIQGIKQMQMGTNTYRALDFVNTNVYPSLRKNSYKILITMTDGDARDRRNNQVISQARKNFNRTVAVGVGQQINLTQLQDFSSTNHIFTVQNFGELKNIISSIKKKICSDFREAAEGSIS